MDLLGVDLILENIAGFLDPEELLTLNETSLNIHNTLITFPAISNRLEEAKIRVLAGDKYLDWAKPLGVKTIARFLTPEELLTFSQTSSDIYETLQSINWFNRRLHDAKIRVYLGGNYLDWKQPLDRQEIFLEAIKNKDNYLVDMIWEDNYLYFHYPDRNTVLTYAIKYHNNEVALKLIDMYVADPFMMDVINIKTSPEEYNALMLAVLDNNKEIVMKLIQAGVYLDARNIHGETALMLTIYNQDADITKMLIDAGADLNLQENTSGDSALMRAIFFNKMEMAILMIEAGANLEIRNLDGKTALMMARKYYPEIVPNLIEAGAVK